MFSHELNQLLENIIIVGVLNLFSRHGNDVKVLIEQKS